VKSAGTDDPDKVAAEMRKTPVNDFMTQNASIRADGRVMRPGYLFQVKTPAESKGAWDYYKQLAVIPAEQAARPLKDGGCDLVK